MSNMIFIQETKCSIEKIKQIHNKWLNKFEFLEVKAENTARGILTLWNPQKVNIVDVEATRNYLSAIIQPMGMSETFLVTNVYGPQRIDEKLRFLNSLADLRSRHEEIPWVIGGDFNMIKSLSEKKGGTRILSRDLVGFHSFTEDTNMVDSEKQKGIKNENNRDRDQYIKEIIKNIPRMVSREDNFNLNKPITEAEVSMGILEVVEDSRRSKSILKVLNNSFISLIPKQDLALTPNKFRPIALCNVVYKIISKVLANRLKPLRPSLISGEQPSYVKGRQILDNIIQAHEVVHSLTSKRQAGMIM
eukprot:PITA_06614